MMREEIKDGGCEDRDEGSPGQVQGHLGSVQCRHHGVVGRLRRFVEPPKVVGGTIPEVSTLG